MIGDQPEGTTHPRIYHALDPFIPLPQLKIALDVMEQAIERDELPRLMTEIRGLVAGFKPEPAAAAAHQTAAVKLRIVQRAPAVDIDGAASPNLIQ